MSPEDDAALSREQRALGPKYASEELTLALLRATRAERQLAEAIAEGRRLERAAIVAWLHAADSETLVWYAAKRVAQGWHIDGGEQDRHIKETT